VPEFGPGDTLRVMVKVIEEADSKEAKARAKAKSKDGKTEEKTVRSQAYEGVCIARQGTGVNESFTVRKISYGEGVERVFPIHSPIIGAIEVLRRGKVRRAKLYYLRGRRGKAARIIERTDARAKKLAAAWKGFKKPKGEADDLKKINGLTEAMEKQLNALNVTKYEQIVNFTDEEIARVDEALQLKGRLERDDWVGQATRLLAETTVGEVPAGEDAAAGADKA